MRLRSRRLSHLALALAIPATLACGDVKNPNRPDGGGDAGSSVDGRAVGSPPDTMLDATPAALSNEATARFEFSSDVAGVSFECSLDGATPAPCTSPHDAAVDEGDHTFEVTAIDADNQRDATPASFSWTVDLTPPDVTITVAPAALDNSTTVSFEFTADEAATFECTTDGATAVPCTSPFEVSGLADGAHQFTVSATDAAGNADPTPATHDWTVDTSSPDTQIDTGPSGDVSDTTASFTFSSADAGAGAVFECSLDGASFATCTSPVDLTGLGEGEHTFEVRVRDATNNVDPTPASRTWTVDTVAPTATVTGGPNGSTSMTQPSFTFSTSGDPVTVECRFDGDAFVACTSPVSPTGALSEGAHSLEIRVTDAAGNSSVTTHNFSVDTMGPTLTITAGPNGPTNDTTPTFSFTAGASAAVVQCRMNSDAYAACSGSFTSSALSEGSHTFYVRAEDSTGNETVESRGFTVDVTPPTVTIDAPSTPTNDTTPSFTFSTGGSPTAISCWMDSGSPTSCTTSYTATAQADGSHTFNVRVTDAAGNTATDQVTVTVDTEPPTVTITPPTSPTNDTTPSVTFSTGGSPSTIRCWVDSGSESPCTTSYTSPTTLGQGNHTFYVRATDAAGNSTTESAQVTIDTTPPTVSITPPTSPTNDTTPSFSFTTGGSPITIRCWVDSGSQSPCTTSYTSPTTLGEGGHTFYVRATDTAGNVTTRSAPFTVDTTPPTVSIDQPNSPTNDATPSFTFTTGGSPTSIRCRMDSGSESNCTTSYTASTLSHGNHTFYVRVTDEAGNEHTGEMPITIDLNPPTLTLNSYPAYTNDTTPTLSYSVSGQSGINCYVSTRGWGPCSTNTYHNISPALGQGTYTFTIRANDTAGNTVSESTSFTVDTTAPGISMDGNSPKNGDIFYNLTQVTFGWTTSGNPAGTRCRLYVAGTTAPGYSSCTSPKTYGITTQKYTFQVQVYDLAGNTRTITITFDNQYFG